MVYKCIIVLFLLLSVSINAAEPEIEDNVLVLTDDNFDQTLAANKYILVEFYAPWCGHCKKLTPEYAGAAGELKADGLVLAKLDATVHKQAAEKFKIQGFPTLKFFTNGQDIEYNGGRSKNEIVQWMRKKTGPASRELSSVSATEAFMNTSDAVVVLIGSNGLDTYTNFARSFEDVVFGHCLVDECVTHFNVANGTVVVFKNFDEKRNELAAGYDFESFKLFIDSKTLPTIMKFDDKSAQVIFGKATPGLFLYYDKNSEDASALEAILTEVAPKLKGRIQVLSTGITQGLETRLAEYIGITQKNLPTIRIADTRSELKKYTMSASISTDNILAFVSNWESGRLTSTLKSEEIPATQDEAVYVVVGKSFDDVVMDDTKDVLIEFYAPWCGHCKTIAPIYLEVAQKLAHNKNLVIAKMDATANETDKVSIQGFPTIKFFPAGKKNAPMEYDGERTVEGFIEYLSKHSTHNVSHKDDL